MSTKEMHSVNEKYVKDGKVVVHEEFAIHGEKGLTIKFYHKENDKIMKVVIVKKSEGFSVKMTMDGKTEESTLTKADLLKELKKHKQLKFAVDFIESAKGLARSGSRKGSKKGSKKGSRKGSRKMSRKGSKKSSKKSSRKGSRKMSRKGSKKGSKKSSRKGSRKMSRKGSKKGSKKSSRKGSRKMSRKGSKKSSRKVRKGSRK